MSATNPPSGKDQVDPVKMNKLIAHLRDEDIPVFVAGDEEYELSVATSNLLYRYSRPDCVVIPRNELDVQTVVMAANSDDYRVPIIIKNGGHSYAGFSTTEKGISLDLRRMKKVTVDINSMTATVGGGALWGHAYKHLVNGRHDGYIINGGRCPTVGVSGFILGGGLGPFTRSFGMGCDTLIEARIVTADGTILTVKESDPKDSENGKLFWALCGAGGGNFGVVVKMKLRIEKLADKEGRVVAGRYEWPPTEADFKEKEDGSSIFLDTMNKFYNTAWPNGATIDTSWVCELGKDFKIRFLVYFDGKKGEFNTMIQDNITHEVVKPQLQRRCLEESSSRFLHETLVSQWKEEIIKSLPDVKTYAIYTSFIFRQKIEKIKEITDIIHKEMGFFKGEFKGETATLQVTWIHSGGYANEKKRHETAYRWRGGDYHAYIMIQWEGKYLELEMKGFLQKFANKLRHFSMAKKAVFINFPDGDMTEGSHEQAYYGNNHLKLQQIKGSWDPTNFFKWHHGVKLPVGINQQEEAPTTAISMESVNVYGRVANTAMSAAVEVKEIDPENLAETKHEEAAAMDPPPSYKETVDAIATKAWDSYTLPPAKGIDVGFKTATAGSIFGLDDLGF
ncbi:hypothetical protein H072_11449 [Dactylellina haptotyla CBS 200.50]|uniref:FAD-binding PCMH-type domain-containing protein n=1 Tax=Dactylellina haptotyla (strain CBS 200.50) TaxID=1284197 RepID=S7ZXC2_DACHA|nr:hypothetical protein H072_11449 [Dactylellina haptotyla CBS 200.50]